MKFGNERKKRRRNALLFVCFLLCGVLAALLILIKVFKVEEIKFEGLHYYSEEEFLDRISDKVMRKNTLLFSFRDRFEHRTSIPYIEDYEIEKNGKNSITIRVYEKILIGCVDVMGDYLYFDKDGLVTESSSEWISEIPLIKGLTFDRIMLYEKLVISKEELYQRILNLTKLIHEYSLPVLSVSFNSRSEVEIETENLTITLGKRDAYDLQIKKIAELFESVKDRKLKIDLSNYRGETSDIIAKPKGE